MEIQEEKLIVNNDELLKVKRANYMASPTVAGFYLMADIKRSDPSDLRELRFFIEAILCYRRRKVEII